MKRWTLRFVFLGLLGYAAFWVYDHYRAGYFSLPDLPEGAYTISFKSGFRAIVLDAKLPDHSMDNAPKLLRRLSLADRERRYLGFPMEIQPWFTDAWSWCMAPSEDERSDILLMPAEFQEAVENTRFESVCRITIDGNDVVRGLIFSVPRL